MSREPQQIDSHAQVPVLPDDVETWNEQRIPSPTTLRLRWRHWSQLGSLNSVETPALGRTLARVALAAFGVTLFCLVALPWVQTAPGSGQVIAYAPNERQQEIGATVDGRVAKWYVVEGQRVAKGDKLVEIADIDPDIMNKLTRERQAAVARLRAVEVATQTSQLNVERQRALADQGLSAERAFEMAKIELNRQMADLEVTRAELARIDLRLARQGSQIVTSPRDGQILRIVAPEAGPVVKAGQSLAMLVPDAGMRAVELLVDGNDVPLVYEGRSVRLQFEGWPAVQFSGWPSVAVGTFGGKVGFVDAAANRDGKFRVIVFPEQISPNGSDNWPSARYLRQGVRANAWILLDTVRIGYEIWRQFNGFPPRAASDPQVGGASGK